MQQSNGGANPQEIDMDLAYLGGLYDGEGYIGVIKGNNRKRKTTGYQPNIVLVNTDPNIINKAQKVLTKYGIAHHIYSSDDGHKNHALKYQIVIRRGEMILRFVEFVGPYLVGKAAQAELVATFTKKRLVRTNYQTPFDEEDMECYENLKELNSSRSSEAIRRTPEEGEEMVQSL